MGNVLTTAAKVAITLALSTPIGAAIATPILAAFGFGGIGIAGGTYFILVCTLPKRALTASMYDTHLSGLRETKQVLRETLEWPTKYGPIFAQSPLRLRSGYVHASSARYIHI